MSDSAAAPSSQDTSKNADQLVAELYEELRTLAANKMRHENPNQTLQATALVHEAWLRLGGDKQPHWQNRAHFFASAAEAMRRILVDNARRKKTGKHGGGLEPVALEFLDLAAGMEDERLLALNEAVDRFAAKDPLKAELVKLRFFAGLTLTEAAQTLGLSEPTAKRYWSFARAWLHREITRTT